MKKLIAILLAAVMLLGLTACGSVNDREVAIIWDDAGTVQIPDSLINSVERAMYTQNIAYTHYGANGSQEEQTRLARTALDNGCAALLVKPVDPAAAQELADMAKAKDVSIVFFGCEVDENVLSSYEKCYCVSTDADSLAGTQAGLLEAQMVKEKKDAYSLNPEMDRNADGKVTCITVGEVQGAVEALNASLAEKGLPGLETAAVGVDAAYIEGLTESVYTTGKNVEMGLLCTADGASVDLILVESDTAALDVLVALQAKGFNADKLTTHCIPLYTTGNCADYKAHVLADRPAGDRKDEAVQAYYKQMQYLVDLSNVEDDDLDEMVYNTYNVIGDGRIAGTCVEDDDAIAAALARITRDIVENVQTGDSRQVWIPYTTYTG